MNNLKEVKLHKSQRLAKIEKRKEVKDGTWTPPKLFNKNLKQNKYRHIESQMGYDYNFGCSKSLKWMWE